MALILADRVKETSTTTGNGVFTLAGATTGFQSFAIVGNGNTTFYCIAGQGTSEWEVGIGTYASAGTTLTRTTVLSNSSATEPSALSFAAGTKDVFVTYPSEKSVNLDASGNATALGTPVTFTGTNITGTATSFTASNVTTNANLTGGVTSVGNAATVVTNANLTGGVTSVGNAATVITNANLTGEATSVGNATTLTNSAVIGKVLTGYTSGAGTVADTDTILQAIQKLNGNTAAAAGVPAGSIVGFGSATPPTGWLACNGANVSRTTYATLFAVISTTFGVGDGTTTFTLPTSARRTLVGSGGSATGTLSNTVGSSGGEETHVQSGSELAGHIHSFSTVVTAATGGTRVVRGAAGTQVGFGVDSSGSSAAANIMQPSLVINYIIKT